MSLEEDTVNKYEVLLRNIY